MTETKEEIRYLWALYTGVEPYDNGKDTLRSLEVDSLSHMELVVDLENEFDIEIDDDEAESVLDMSFSDLVDFVQNRRDQ